MLSPRFVTHAFRRYAKLAGLPDHLTLHDLRHTAITRLIEQGADLFTIAALAGHAKTSTTTDVYGHAFEGHMQEAALRFDPAKPAPHRIPTPERETSSNDVLSAADDD